MRPRNLFVTGLLLTGLLLAACSGSSKHSAPGSGSTAPTSATAPDCSADACVRLNQVQVIGTHNSYHIQDPPKLLNALKAFDKTLGESIEYTHPPLPDQFSKEGVRQIELDVFADPQGGRYAKRRVLAAIGEPIDPHIPALAKPGFKVLHVQDVDFNSTCLTFVDCLTTIRTWSHAHPKHLPIAILIEAKDDPVIDPLKMGFVQPPPINAGDFDRLDAEIRSVFPPTEMITPDDVRGKHATLEESVLTGTGWPTLSTARGKVIFLLDQGDQRDLYLTGHPGLKGRVIFTNAKPGEPDAAFVEMNDPNGKNLAAIQALVQKGYIVRSRSDGDTVEGRSNDTTSRDNAIASGAQYVSTDYPYPDKSPFSPFVVTLPGNRSWRCDPVNAPPSCAPATLDALG